MWWFPGLPGVSRCEMIRVRAFSARFWRRWLLTPAGAALLLLGQEVGCDCGGWVCEGVDG